MEFALSVRFWSRVGTAIALLFSFPGASALASPSGTYSYAIHHPEFGEVGTYTNVIRRQGAETVVRNRVEVAVRALFMVVYRFSADRTEIWRNGRLVRYLGKANDDGAVISLRGDARGDRFIIQGPKGTVAAPADIVPTNPWELRLTRATVNMTTTTGKVVPARIAETSEREIVMDGTRVRARYVRLKAGHEMWYDRRGVLLRFTYPNKGKVFQFVLRRVAGRSTASLPPPDADGNNP